MKQCHWPIVMGGWTDVKVLRRKNRSRHVIQESGLVNGLEKYKILAEPY